MRFVIAIVSFVVAIGMIGYGVAQRTFLAEPSEMVASLSESKDPAVTVIDGKTLNAFDGSQTITITSSGPIFAAYGRTDDVAGWIGDTTINKVSYSSKTGDLTSKTVTGKSDSVPDPRGSDLWLDEYSHDKRVSLTVKVPADVSFVIISDGKKPAPGDISITWPIDNRTPFSGPLIIGGTVLLLAGLAVLLWALNHQRKTRGPRRKPPKMPKVPRQRGMKAVTRAKTKALEVTGGRRATRRGLIAVLPVVLVSTLALSGCGAFGSASGSTPSPTPSTAQQAGVDVPPPAVTVRQIQRIVADVATVAATADAKLDTTLIATRFEGPALQLRLADYAIRKADGSIAAVPAIPTGPVEVILPQQTDSWPRTVFAVVKDDKDKTVAPVALFLVQDDPRSQYKVNYAVTLEPSAKIPPLAPAIVGAARLDPGVSLFAMAPDGIAAAYGDILLTDKASTSYEKFDEKNDSLIKAVGLDAKNAIKAGLSTTASITYTTAAGAGDTIVLATNDSGALVAVNLNETTVVAPVETGAAVNPSGAVKALSAIGVTVKGIQAVYGDQLLFYVPAASSKAKIVLLGYSQGLVSATELP
ncbi:MAG: hypothetical protein ABJB03_09215 [Rhodoglobus sp.]